MKTIEQLNHQLQRLSLEKNQVTSDKDKSSSEIKKAVNRINKEAGEISEAINFLKFGYTVDYLEKQLFDINAKINKIEALYPQWRKTNIEYISHENPRPIFDRQYNLTHLRKQVKFLQFILS